MMNRATLSQLAQQLQRNPIPFFQRAGFNVPSNLTNPNDIIQHLMNSGQVTQQRYNWARQTAEQWRGK